MLSKKRFSTCQGVAVYQGKLTNVTYYCYESKNDLFDVIYIENAKKFIFRRNMQSVNEKHAIHELIEKHFSLI